MKIAKNYATRYIGLEVEIKISRPLGSMNPKYGFTYDVHFGSIPAIESTEGIQVEAYLFGIDDPVEKFTGVCIAVIRRHNKDNDMLVIIPSLEDTISDNEIRKATHFQEQFFTSDIIREK